MSEPVTCAELQEWVRARLGEDAGTVNDLTPDELALYRLLPRGDRAVSFFAPAVRAKRAAT